MENDLAFPQKVKHKIIMCVCSVAQPCLTFCNPTDCSPPGSSVHGIFQASILEQVAIAFSRVSAQPREQNQYNIVKLKEIKIKNK